MISGELLRKLSESLNVSLLCPSFDVNTVQLAIELFAVIMKLLKKDYFKNEDNMLRSATKAISELLYDALQKNKATMEVFDEEYESFKSIYIAYITSAHQLHLCYHIYSKAFFCCSYW